MTRAWRPASLAVVLVLLALLPLVVSAGNLVVADFVLAAIVGGLSLHLITGLTGLLSLGSAAFFGVGAYVTAAFAPGRFGAVDRLLGSLPGPLALLAGNQAGWPLILGLVAGGLAAALVALAMAPLALRFRDVYLAIVTLGLLYLATYVFVNWTGLTGGGQGLSFGAPALGGLAFGGSTAVAGLIFPSAAKLYYLWGVIAVLLCLAAWRLRRSRSGRALVAIREREAVAASLAVPPTRYKTWALVLSGFLAGVAGAMLAVTTGFAVPQSWDLELTIQYVTVIIVGGIGTVRGTVLGALFVVGLPALLRTVLGADVTILGVPLPLAQQLFYGAAVVVFLLLAPGGLGQLLDRLLALMASPLPQGWRRRFSSEWRSLR